MMDSPGKLAKWRVSVVGTILFASGDSVSILAIIAGLVIPIVYIIGTIQLKKQAE